MFKQIDNIQMRFIELEDKDILYQAMNKNREFLGQYIDFANHITEGQLETYIKNWQAMQVLGRGFQIGLFNGEEILGQCSVNLDSHDKRAEIGYWLIQDATGRGLMTRAVDQVLRICFEIYKLNKVSIKCVDTNKKSMAIAQRLGFVYEGRLRQHQKLKGVFRDLLVYSILKEEWRQSNGSF